MLFSNTHLYNWAGSAILQTLVLMTGVVVNGKLYYLYIFIMLHYNSALLLTVDLIYIYIYIYIPKSFYSLYIDLLYWRIPCYYVNTRMKINHIRHKHPTRNKRTEVRFGMLRNAKKGGKTSDPLQQYFQKEMNKENHISLV